MKSSNIEQLTILSRLNHYKNRDDIKSVSPDDIFFHPVETYINHPLLMAISDAKSNVDICVYEIGDPALGNALAKAIDNGVYVRIVVNNAWYSRKKLNLNLFNKFREYIYSQLGDASNRSRLQMYWASNNYDLTHAKYVLIDQLDKQGQYQFMEGATKLFISTGNLKSYDFQNKEADWDLNKGFFSGVRDIVSLFSSKANEPVIREVHESFENQQIRKDHKEVTGQSKVGSNTGLVWSNGSSLNGKFPEIGNYPCGTDELLLDKSENWQVEGNSLEILSSLLTSAQKSVVAGMQDDVGSFFVRKLIESFEYKKLAISIMAQFDRNFKMNLRAFASTNLAAVFVNENKAFYHHAKYFIVDDEIAYIGSINLDLNSVLYGYELGYITRDKTIITKIKEQHAIDITRKQVVYLHEHLHVASAYFEQGLI